MCIWELSTETNRIETAVVRYGVATIFATVLFRRNILLGEMIPSVVYGFFMLSTHILIDRSDNRMLEPNREKGGQRPYTP